MYLLRKGVYRDISHIILKHTISNKLISKVSALKKGGGSNDSNKYVFKFRWFQSVVALDDTSQDDMVAESWDHWVVSQRDSPSMTSEEAPAV